MKSLVYVAPQRVEVRDVPVPELHDHQVRIRVKYCGVCGSDIGIYSGSHPRAKAPLILGHEFIGIIDEIKNGSGRFKKGDRVSAYPLLSCKECFACKNGMPHVCKTLKLIGIDIDGGMAEYVNVDEDVLFKLNDELSDRAAVVIEPLSVILHSVHQINFQARDTALVIGAGPIGILTGIVLKNIGASKIIISDIDTARLEMCREYGFDAINVKDIDLVDYVDKVTGGVGVDVVFECSGNAAAARDITKLTRIGGKICITGVHKEPHVINLQDVNFKEQTLVGSRVYTLREFAQTVEYAKEIQKDLEKIVTHIVGWDHADEIFDYIKNPALNTVKVVIDCRN